MSKTLKLQLAGAIYALHRAVQVHRHDDSGRQLNPMAVLQSWFKKSGIQHVQGARDIMTGSLQFLVEISGRMQGCACRGNGCVL